MLSFISSSKRLVLGCGNPLFGDDGFGAKVIQLLETSPGLPKDAACLDVGTAVRDLLFDIILSDEKPDQIIIIDAMTLDGAIGGEIQEIGIDEMQASKICDYSLHQFPTTNLLKEIQELTSIDVKVLVVHPEHIPSEVRPGLSESVRRSVPLMCLRIMDILNHTLDDTAASLPPAYEFQVGVLSRRMGVHRNTLTNWIKQGRFRATPAAGRRYRVDVTELRRFCRASGFDETYFLQGFEMAGVADAEPQSPSAVHQ